MTILLKSATIIDATSSYHQQKKDILITDGIITKISNAIKPSATDTVIDKENLHVSCGWFDTSVSFGEPGYEDRETILNGIEVAAKSGFTGVAVNANTNPVTDTKSSVLFLTNAAANSATKLYPIGALTKGSKGKDMAELYDMTTHGAIGFYDYKKPVENDNLLKLSLQYTQAFNGVVMSFPKNNNIALDGIANEGENSVILGLKGAPELAEHLQIARDLFILEYTGGQLHIPTISTKKSIELIQNAKKNGLQVTCSVSAHHLFLNDKELHGFNSNFKTNPPLRTIEDCKALQRAVKNNSIDCITSDHNPITIEDKKVEFSAAKDGTIGLESCFGALNSLFKLDDFIEQITNKPRAIFNLNIPCIGEGETADITLFNPENTYTFAEKHIQSTSKNSAFLNKTLKGRVYGIVANNKLVLNN